MPLFNCEIELDLIWLKNCEISEISRTSDVPANPSTNLFVMPREATLTTGAIFQINNAKRYVSIVTLSRNNNIKFLEHLKQGFKRTIACKKYRSEIRTEPKNNHLD